MLESVECLGGFANLSYTICKRVLMASFSDFFIISSYFSYWTTKNVGNKWESVSRALKIQMDHLLVGIYFHLPGKPSAGGRTGNRWIEGKGENGFPLCLPPWPTAITWALNCRRPLVVHSLPRWSSRDKERISNINAMAVCAWPQATWEQLFCSVFKAASANGWHPVQINDLLDTGRWRQAVVISVRGALDFRVLSGKATVGLP